MRLPNWVRHPTRKQLVLSILTVLVIFGLILRLAVFRAPPLTTDNSIKHYYSQKFIQLETAVQGLKPTLEPTTSTQVNLDRYSSQLTQVINPCAYITAKYPTAASQKISAALKDSLSQSNRLCSDLTAVAKYSAQLYTTCHVYLTVATNWPPVNDPAYAGDLAQLKQVIQGTKDSINNIDNSFVKDPAPKELVKQLDNTDGLADQVQTALKNNDLPQAGRLSDNLMSQINKDKINFLAARKYYWNNTAQFYNLQKSIEKLKNQFR